MSKPRLLSGIQPSGNLMIGNYIGSLKNWVRLQEDYQCLFSLVDMHAITVRQEPKALHERCLDFISLYLASGIDPAKSTVFIQSHVPQHAELAWALNCHTYMGELERMTQFKDKSARHAQNINAGLFNYPVLMAADILLYDTELVPVGNDQKQHLELTRDLAQRFNQAYAPEDAPIFRIPEPFIPPVSAGGRIMALQDPDKKMSKSDENDKNYVALLDAPKVIEKKIKSAVTDTETVIAYDPETKAGVSNLLTIFSVISGRSIESLVKDYEGKMYGHLKVDLAALLVDYLAPIQAEYARIRHDQAYLSSILAKGRDQAREIAQQKLDQVYKALGFVQI
jgi:tryptophanyl-tRNA synthetase